MRRLGKWGWPGLGALVVGLAVLGWAAWWVANKARPDASSAPPDRVEEAAERTALGDEPDPQPGDESTAPPGEPNPLMAVEDELLRAGSPEAALAILEALKSTILSGDADRWRERILDYLATGRDVETGLPFRVGPGQQLRTWPTLRVALLDWLGQLDGAAALAQAPALLSDDSTTPAERALALRALIHEGGEPHRGRVIEEMAAMLRRQDWLDAPSDAYLHSLDAVVAVDAVELVPDLAKLVKVDAANPQLSFAASLVLDRLAIQQPGLLLAKLGEAPGSLDQAPAFRAGLVARADFRDPEQVAWVDQYLEQPNLSPVEGGAFFELFPNHHLALSYNLISEVRDIGREEMIQRDRAAVVVLEQWRESRRFPEWQAEIESRIAYLRDQLRRGGVDE